MSKSFTLLEVIIVIALLAISATATFSILNPFTQIKKSQDAKRKNDFSHIQKALDDFYNDKNRYPKPSEICYDTISPRNTCHICGKIKTSEVIKPYFSQDLPCDPESPRKNYLYQVDDINFPSWYRVYTNLSLSNYITSDPATVETGCQSQGCGPKPDCGYNYGISSSNIDLERCGNFSYCSTSGCNHCGTYAQCQKININLFCEKKQFIIPADVCGKNNCPCQP